MKNLMKEVWLKWKKFAFLFGTFMSHLILSIIYFTVILPYGLGVRIFSDPLLIKSKPSGSGWRPFPKIEATLKRFSKQY